MVSFCEGWTGVLRRARTVRIATSRALGKITLGDRRPDGGKYDNSGYIFFKLPLSMATARWELEVTSRTWLVGHQSARAGHGGGYVGVLAPREPRREDAFADSRAAGDHNPDGATKAMAASQQAARSSRLLVG